MMSGEVSGSGRTTGQLVASVARAREGETVIYVCPHEAFIRQHAIPLLLLAVLCDSKDWRVWIAISEIRFDSGGRIVFADPSERSALGARGRRCTIIVDHAAVGMDSAWEFTLAQNASDLADAAMSEAPSALQMPSGWLNSTKAIQPWNRGDRFGTVPVASEDDNLPLRPAMGRSSKA